MKAATGEALKQKQAETVEEATKKRGVQPGTKRGSYSSKKADKEPSAKEKIESAQLETLPIFQMAFGYASTLPAPHGGIWGSVSREEIDTLALSTDAMAEKHGWNTKKYAVEYAFYGALIAVIAPRLMASVNHLIQDAKVKKYAAEKPKFTDSGRNNQAGKRSDQAADTDAGNETPKKN